MINSKQDYFFYLEADRLSLGRKTKKPIISDEIWIFQKLLRKYEYYHNCKIHSIPISRVYYSILITKYKLYSMLLGFTIPINTFGPGLNIAHRGTIIINGNAAIGENCRIHAGVNIGTEAGHSGKAPEIGNNIYIGPGAKLFGKIRIADGIVVGANAVVNKSFTDANISIGGIPAKQISSKGSEGLLIKGTELARNNDQYVT